VVTPCLVDCCHIRVLCSSFPCVCVFQVYVTNSFFSLFSSVFGIPVAVPLIILYLISSVFGISTIAAGIGQYLSYFGVSNVLLIEIAVIGAFCWLNITGIFLSGMT
jgi:hypothetical protein